MRGDRMIIRGLNRHGWMAIPSGGPLVAACSSMPKDFEAPRVHIADMAPKEMTLFEQRFDVKLRIEIANDADLASMACDLRSLNEREFASGMSGQRITVPRFGSELVDVECLRPWRASSGRCRISMPVPGRESQVPA